MWFAILSSLWNPNCCSINKFLPYILQNVCEYFLKDLTYDWEEAFGSVAFWFRWGFPEFFFPQDWQCHIPLLREVVKCNITDLSIFQAAFSLSTYFIYTLSMMVLTVIVLLLLVLLNWSTSLLPVSLLLYLSRLLFLSWFYRACLLFYYVLSRMSQPTLLAYFLRL